MHWHKYIEEAFFSGIGMSTLRKHFNLSIGMIKLGKQSLQVFA